MLGKSQLLDPVALQVPQIVLATPPRADGSICPEAFFSLTLNPLPCLPLMTFRLANGPRQFCGQVCPEVIYAAKRAGATKILKAGGAQAIVWSPSLRACFNIASLIVHSK